MWAGGWCPIYLLLVDAACGLQGEECLRGNGEKYGGSQQITTAGTQCLNWLQVSRDPSSPLPAVFEDHSYCRNPDHDVRPWCYVSEGGEPQKQHCTIQPCGVPLTSTAQTDISPHTGEEEKQVFEPADSFSMQSESAAVQPVIGISQRMRVNSKEKKDLGTLGYVLGLLMMLIIIAIGSGIVIGYMYKRGKALKQQHEQRVYERELQRITLPLSAFSNPTCDFVDENTVVVHPTQTPVEEAQQEGDTPLMGQAGTPGA